LAWSSALLFVHKLRLPMSDGGWKMREHHLAFTEWFQQHERHDIFMSLLESNNHRDGQQGRDQGVQTVTVLEICSNVELWDSRFVSHNAECIFPIQRIASRFMKATYRLPGTE